MEISTEPGKGRRSDKTSAQIKAFSRSYLATKAPGPFLRDFLRAQGVSLESVEKIVIASSFLEKILSSKIGGTVGQVTTAGFEHWPRLRQNLQSPFLQISPQRTDALALQDLLFPLNERMDCHGRVLQPLQDHALDELMASLKSKQLQRVCVNLLFAHRNNAHEQKIVDRLKAEGFEVFVSSHRNEETDEVSTWRKNVLNASLCGTFDEMRDSILSELEGVPVWFLNSSLGGFLKEREDLSTSIFAPHQILCETFKDPHYPHLNPELNTPLILNLGLENWSILESSQTEAEWDSPWGRVTGPIPALRWLQVQPTQEYIFAEFQGLKLSTYSLGFEPGPMMLGRALKPTLFDLLILKMNKEKWPDWVRGDLNKFIQSMKAHLRTWKSTDSKMNNFENEEDLFQSLLTEVVDQIGLQTFLEFKSTDNPKNVCVTGYFASLFVPLLQKSWPEVRWQLDPDCEIRIAAGAALRPILADSK